MTAQITEEKTFGWHCEECSDGEDGLERLSDAERHAYRHDTEEHS